MDDLADLLQGVEVGDGGRVGKRVDRDLGDVYRPGEAGVGVAFKFVVVPEDIARSFVARGGDERTATREVGECGAFEVGGGVAGRDITGDGVVEVGGGVGMGEDGAREASRDSDARSTSLPTIMAVREATVGPELGTMLVSGWATRTSS